MLSHQNERIFECSFVTFRIFVLALVICHGEFKFATKNKYFYPMEIMTLKIVYETENEES